jgi:hypothetical protein
LARARAAFTEALPKIRALAHTCHRRLYGDLHDEAVAETEAFAWKAFRDLTARGRDPVPLAGRIIKFAAGWVKAGDRFAGKLPVRDALSPESQRRHGYLVTALPQGDDDEVAAEVRVALAQRGPTPAEEAAARLDYEAWLAVLDPRSRAVAEGLAEGLNPTEIGARFGLSRRRIYQIAAGLKPSYDQFQGGGEEQHRGRGR